MTIRKAVITAAGQNQRSLPLQSLVDRDGVRKSALRIVIEEVVQAGIEDICLVIHPGDDSKLAEAADPHAGRIRFVEQPEPRGYGHAVFCSHDFVGDEPFLLLVSDHLYVSRQPRNCARQLIDAADAESCSVSAVQATRESNLPYFGAVGGRLDQGRPHIFLIENVIEKPTPTEAEQHLIVPGLRAGHYLCFFGMHVLSPRIMEILESDIRRGTSRIQLSPALAELAGKERYLALEVQGQRYDLDAKYGLMIAQLGLALAGNEREEVLAQLVELLAQRVS